MTANQLEGRSPDDGDSIALLALQRANAAINKPSGGGTNNLIQTASGFAAGPVALNNLTFTPIVSASVTVAAGQKVIVQTSVEYDAGAGNGTAQRLEQQDPLEPRGHPR